MKDSNEQRIQNQFGAFCARGLKNETGYIQREYTGLRDQEESLGELRASELEQTAYGTSISWTSMSLECWASRLL